MKDSTKRKRLKPEQRLLVVQCLARFMTPSEVETLVREDFGVSITRQSIEGYDPTKVAGQGLNELELENR